MIFSTKNRRISGWQKVRFVGVKKNKDESYSMLFRLVDYDEWASVYIDKPPFKSESLVIINAVREANKKEPIAEGEELELPLSTDEDKQVWIMSSWVILLKRTMVTSI